MLYTIPPSGNCNAHAFRLNPGDQVMQSLKDYAALILSRQHPDKCSSAFILTAVGSVSDITLRLANASKITSATTTTSETAKSTNDIVRLSNQRFEVVSLVGTFSRTGGCHLHISLSDANGNTIGGHLVEGVVFTTLEVVIGTADYVEFSRDFDDRTGYNELVPKKINTDKKLGIRNILIFSMFLSVASIILARSNRLKP